MDGGFGRIEIDAGIADSGEDSTPIRVFAVHRGLHEVRGRNRPSCTVGIHFTFCTSHSDLDEFCCAFAIQDDHFRQVNEQFIKRVAER